MEEEKEVVVKEKKDVKKSKGWGRRSTRAKKYISYRYVSLLTHYYLMLFIHSCYSLFIVTIVRFDEFDEAIEEAIEEDIKEAEGGGRGAFSYITLVLIFKLGYGSLD